MDDTGEQFVAKQLYVFNLPSELLRSLFLKDLSEQGHAAEAHNASDQSPSLPTTKVDETASKTAPTQSTAACSLCDVVFPNVIDQRSHVKSDWHGYNVKQRVRGRAAVTEPEFEKLIGDLDESISGSDSSTSEEDEASGGKDNVLASLLKKQAKINALPGEEESICKKSKRGSGNAPLIWFSSPKLPSSTFLGVYRALFSTADMEPTQVLQALREKQLQPIKGKSAPNAAASASGPSVFLCMIGGGHFAAMIVSLTPKLAFNAKGVEERQAIVIAHKTFHRYTTRRKQGGAQSANDSAKGAAHSAGAGIRRYNEAALESEVRALLAEWKGMLSECQLLFIRATGTTNRRTLFGPYDGQVLRQNDPRNRTIPFSSRRATQAELMRAFVELTRVKVSHIDEAALAAAAAAATAAATAEAKDKEATLKTHGKPSTPKPSAEEEALLLHTSQLQSLIRRSKAPAVLGYLTKNALSADLPFHPPTTQAHHHASTPLHLAASINSPAVVLALLTKAVANPATLNGEGKPPFDLAGDRATRDAFRVARHELGEEKWDWEAARCPPGLERAEAERREEGARREGEREEAERRRGEVERLKGEELERDLGKGRKVGRVVELSGAEKREQEARGLAPEMRARLERERRARAAEERMRQG